MVVLILKTNIGDGRQRAEERMDNKYKNKTLKHLERNEPKSIYSMPLTTLLAKGRDSFSLANNAQSDCTFQAVGDRSAGPQGGSL